jgi:hypothetical protein
VLFIFKFLTKQLNRSNKIGVFIVCDMHRKEILEKKQEPFKKNIMGSTMD